MPNCCVNDLLAHDLIDEIHLMIGNLLLGEGVPVFVGKPDVTLHTYPQPGVRIVALVRCGKISRLSEQSERARLVYFSELRLLRHV